MNDVNCNPIDVVEKVRLLHPLLRNNVYSHRQHHGMIERTGMVAIDDFADFPSNRT